MRFMSIVKSSEDYRQGPPPQALMEAIGKLGEEAMQAGLMVDMGGLLPTSAGFRIRQSGGKLTVTEGPFAEAKEFLAGYWIVDVETAQQAYEIAGRASAAPGPGGKPLNLAIEVRQVMSAPPV